MTAQTLKFLKVMVQFSTAVRSTKKKTSYARFKKSTNHEYGIKK